MAGGAGLCQLILLNYLNGYLEVNNMGWRGYKGTIDVGMIFKKCIVKIVVQN